MGPHQGCIMGDTLDREVHTLSWLTFPSLLPVVGTYTKRRFLLSADAHTLKSAMPRAPSGTPVLKSQVSPDSTLLLLFSTDVSQAGGAPGLVKRCFFLLEFCL